MPRKRINHALAGTLLVAGTLSDQEICERVGAKNPESLRAALARHGVTKTAVKSLQRNSPPIETVTMSVVRQASEALREKSELTRSTLADVIVKQAQRLVDTNVPKSMVKQNLHADTTQKVAKAAGAVFGWEEQRSVSIVMPGVLTNAVNEDQPAIDVSSTAEPSESQS